MRNCPDRIVLKKLLLFLLIPFFFPNPGRAQYTNQWINFSQSYYRIPIAKTGIYRLTYSDLQSAGIPVGSVDPRFLQLYHRGQEQAIVVQGQSDASFDPSDYLEFYGQINDGTRDVKLYQSPSLQPHPYYNLYTDTTAYFLTWSALPPAGKRMNNFFENNVTGIPTEVAQNHIERNLYTSQYSGGKTISNGEIQSTVFDEGEGWTDNFICTVNSGCTGFKDYLINNLDHDVTTAGNPVLDLLIVGRDELTHKTEVWVGPNPGALRLVASNNFVDFETQWITADLTWADIAGGQLLVEVKALGVAGIRDKISVSFIQVTLPQDFDLTGQTSKWLPLNPNAGGKSYVEITNSPANARIWDVTDPDNVSTIGTNLSSGILSAVVSGTATARTLLVSNEINKPSIAAVAFQSIDPLSYDYLIVTHASLLSAVQSYSAYRASPNGGSYHPLVVTVDQLYNQFNYGETSPLGIYEFVKLMVQSGSPKYLFLIGKGRDVSAGYQRHPSGFKDLVPSAGLPASDMVFSAGLNGSGYGPSLPTGRISTSTPAQVTAYLSKVMEMESTPITLPWRKQGLHLSGGIQTQPVNELVQFRQYLDGFKTIAEGIYWGGQITTIAKHDANAVEQINIADEVNSGENMITFFGHSSPGTIDIDIGYVTDPTLGYNNPGKYPVFLINGCNAGNFFADGVSFGEDWMLAANRGARAFIAHSSFGFTYTLQEYSDLFYRVGFADSIFITKGIGDVQKEVAVQYLDNFGSQMADIAQVQQMVLLGDPAIKLFGTATPDYATDDASVSLQSLDGKPVTALSDSFAVHVIVKNLGAAKQEVLKVELTRTFNDNSKMIYDSVFIAPLYQDTLVFKLKKGTVSGYGNNQFKVVLDPDNLILELDETNNTGILNKLIPLGGTKNLIPYPYAIVHQSSLDLIFQCTDILSGTRAFQLEIDTVDSFNSPFFQHKVVSGNVLAKSPFDLLSKDSLVYYWRTKLDQPTPDESTDWVLSSFTFINNGPEGWIQKRFGQLFENSFSGLVRDLPAGELEFIRTSADLYVKTFGDNNPSPSTAVSVKINNAEFNLATQGQPCRDNTLNIIAFNKTSLVPYAGLPFSFQDPRTCGREPQVINSFMLNEMETGLGNDLAAMVDAIQTSDSVLLFSIGNANYSSWSASLKTKLHDLGILESQLSGLQDGDPLIILGRKGSSAGTAKIFTAAASPANQQVLQMAETITGRYTSGTMTSVSIGPALQWIKMIPGAAKIQPSDIYRFVCYGIKDDGTSDLLIDNISGEVDLSSIDAYVYPYLKLEMSTQDDVNLDPVQLSKWIVEYTPVPEGVLLMNGPTHPSPVAEGQDWRSDFKFVNISDKTFGDSLTVNFETLNLPKLTKTSNTFRIAPPSPGDTTFFSVATDTRNKAGKNNINVYVNPKILPEQFYENNVADLENFLIVKPDTLAPVLEVTIDGRFVADGDFISPNPVILIRIRDENKFLFKTDTTGIRIVLTYPCSTADCPGQQIFFSRSDVRWFPATATSDFRVEFKPTNLPDGDYTLFVQAADESGNKSGAEPYVVTFKVLNELTFAFQSVYPNPSSGSFFFNFIVSGNVPPDDFALQIYSLDGRVVHEFDNRHITDFHVGTNQLVWEPLDHAGNSLPGGMYLYHLRIVVGGREFAESGKLILVR